MANYLTTPDLLKDALKRVGELTDGSSEFHARALEYLNKWQLAVLAGSCDLDIEIGEPWLWAKSPAPGILILKAPLSTGKVTLTNGSNAGAFTVAPSTSQAGAWLQVAGSTVCFQVIAHVAGTTLFSLDAPFTGPSGSASFRCHGFDFTIPVDPSQKLLRLIGPMRHSRSSANSIAMVDFSTFATQYPMGTLTRAIPDAFTVVAEHDGQITLRFNAVPDSDVRIEFDWIPVPADLLDDPTSIPVLPRAHRVALSYGAAYSLALDKNDSRKDDLGALTKAALQAMVKANRRERIHSARNMGRLTPRADLAGRGRARTFSAPEY